MSSNFSPSRWLTSVVIFLRWYLGELCFYFESSNKQAINAMAVCCLPSSEGKWLNGILNFCFLCLGTIFKWPVIKGFNPASLSVILFLIMCSSYFNDHQLKSTDINAIIQICTCIWVLCTLNVLVKVFSNAKFYWVKFVL